jgi:leader peptidase (prepilin peptidase)/N-methyltransferase
MITALENIPIISYLFLRGKCRQCGTPISIRYPIVEALSAVLVLIVAMKFGVSYATLFGAIFTWVLISLTFIDIDTQYLPDQLTLPMLWLGVLLALDGMYVDITASVIGAVAGYMVLWTVYQVFKLLTKKEGMGFGDFKLLAMIGAWCGWQVLPAVILISSVIGSIAGILMVITKYHEKGKPIPFGPYLAGAGWIVFMWGQQINNFYLNLFN